MHSTKEEMDQEARAQIQAALERVKSSTPAGVEEAIREANRRREFSLDPRLGLDEDEVIALAAVGACRMLRSFEEQAAELLGRGSLLTIHDAHRVTSILDRLQTQTRKDIEIGLYKPSNPSDADVSYHTGWRSYRIGVQRYDKYRDLSPVEEFQLSAGERIPVPVGYAESLCADLLTVMYSVGRISRRHMESILALPPLYFEKPVGVSGKKRPLAERKATVRQHAIDRLNEAAYGFRQHTYCETSPHDSWAKVEYHLKRHKGPVADAALAQLAQLGAQYGEVRGEIIRLVQELSESTNAVIKLLEDNKLPGSESESESE